MLCKKDAHAPHQTTETQTDPNPPPEKPTRTKTRNEKNTEPANERRRREKKNRCAGCGAKPWGRCGARSTGWSRSPRPGRRNTRGSTNPAGVCGSPGPERERERETERQREKERKTSSTNIPTNNQRKKERTSNTNPNKGQVLKGTKTKQHLDPRDQKYHTNKPDIYPESTEQKNQSPNKQSLGGFFTAGWRGPWAALHFWGDTPGDRSTEGYKYPPTTGTAPGGAKANNRPDTKQIPQKFCPSTWPFLNYRTRPHRTKQTQKDNRADM